MITFFGIIGLVIGITNLLIGYIVYAPDRKNIVKQWWALFAISVSIWGFGAYIISISISPEDALFWWRVAHIGIIMIPASFLIFTLSFFGKSSKIKVAILSIFTLFFLVINFTDYFISSVQRMFDEIYYDGPPTFFYNIFVIYFVLCMSSVLYIAIRAYSPTKDHYQKRQILFFTIATLIGSLGGSTSFLPVYGIEIYPYFNATIILFPFIIGYAILRYNLFDLKAVITELLMFCIWIALLLRTIFATDSKDLLINILLLSIIVLIGLLLIRSVRKEIKIRENTEKLAKDLEEANVRLKELDQQKSEFVSLASHQLRGPLTAIKGYASMLLDGDFGEIDKPEIKDAVDKIYTSTQSLVILVADYLDVSRIEQGRMQYDFTTFDMKDLVATVGVELAPNIERAKLTYKFDFDQNVAYKVNADMGKIKQVIGNIIDNAIKYTPKGGIHVWLSKPGNHILVSITDTGVGIRPDVLPRLFEKFTRAPDASKTNIMGTGLGLYVARKMVEAHHGRIWAESPGQGKGSSFFIELEAVQ